MTAAFAEKPLPQTAAANQNIPARKVLIACFAPYGITRRADRRAGSEAEPAEGLQEALEKLKRWNRVTN